MRITGVESTDFFTGSAGRPLQIIRVSAEADGPATIRVAGPGVETPVPASLGEGVAVTIADHHQPGTQVPVTVIVEDGQQRAEHSAMITVAEPGWTMWMVSHFHYDPVWWSTQGQFTQARLVLPDEHGELPEVRTAFELVKLHLEAA